ncbi:MAG TPA: sugar ABC transporter permease [Acidimicrobiales bacterium]
MDSKDSTLLKQRPAVSPPGAASRRRSRLTRIATPYLLLLPAAFLYAVFIVYPIFRQFDISFFNWHIFPGVSNPFVGWTNYSRIFHDPAIRTAAENTLLFLVITVPIQMALGLAAAALVTDRLPGRGLWRALIFLPVVTSWVVVSYVFAYIFGLQGGLANAIISIFAGHTVRIDWLAQTWTGNAVIWIVSIWKGVGWSFIMFLAALDGVPRDLVESARVDGASEPRIWRHVVIPNIRPTITFVSVLLVIGASQVFTQVFITTGGGPFGSTGVLLTYAYQQAFSFFNFSYAAAIASLMAVIVLGLSILQIRLMRRNHNS